MRFLIAVCTVIFVTPVLAASSHFECKDQGNGKFRPFYLKEIAGTEAFEDFSKKPKGLLGQNAMKSLDECQRAVQASNSQHGVICSRTGLDGYKPTLYTGTVPGRADFGYLGGSTIDAFDDCLQATMQSSEKGVCFWGGSDWWVSPITHEGMAAGPFRSLARCLEETAP